MTEPISREEFNSATENMASSIKQLSKSTEDMVDAIKDHIDYRFKTHAEIDELRYKEVHKTLASHDKTLYGDGNGQVGLRMKVDRLNTLLKAASTGIGAGFAALTAFLGLRG